jgi:prefoldin subunit 5
VSDADDALNAMHRYTDSIENIQLYMMQISELMRQLNQQMRTFGELVQALDARVERLEHERPAS